MGELVAVMAASHAPNLLLELGKEWTDFMDLHYSMMPGGNAQRPTAEFAQRFAADVRRTFGLLRAVIDEAQPDALLVVANDQFVNFFYNNIPTFCLGVGAETRGQFSKHAFAYPGHEPLARQLLDTLIEEGFDLAFSEKLELEHTQVVPLHYVLPPGGPTPLIPLFVNTWVAPQPTPRRCHALGAAIARAIAASDARVAMLATGGLSHFPGRPKIGQVDVDFDRPLLDTIARGEGRTLAEHSVARLADVGNEEFLNWMVTLGAAGDATATVYYEPDQVATGIGFAVWHVGTGRRAAAYPSNLYGLLPAQPVAGERR
jgi:2,3-dihydroxyphenylpropionate 1,2-dioxygenase